MSWLMKLFSSYNNNFSRASLILTLWKLAFIAVNYLIRILFSTKDFVIIFENISWKQVMAAVQCGNYGNSLAHFWQKFRESSNGFTKEITKLLIWRIFSSEREFLVFSHSAEWKSQIFSVEKREIHCHAKFFRQIKSE